MSAHIMPSFRVDNWSADHTGRIERREYAAEAVSVGLIIGSTERDAFAVSR